MGIFQSFLALYQQPSDNLPPSQSRSSSNDGAQSMILDVSETESKETKVPDSRLADCPIHHCAAGGPSCSSEWSSMRLLCSDSQELSSRSDEIWVDVVAVNSGDFTGVDDKGIKLPVRMEVRTVVHKVDQVIIVGGLTMTSLRSEQMHRLFRREQLSEKTTQSEGTTQTGRTTEHVKLFIRWYYPGPQNNRLFCWAKELGLPEQNGQVFNSSHVISLHNFVCALASLEVSKKDMISVKSAIDKRDRRLWGGFRLFG